VIIWNGDEEIRDSEHYTRLLRLFLNYYTNFSQLQYWLLGSDLYLDSILPAD
jgi:hypothetical protein